MKYTLALTLMISLVLVGFGGYFVNAQGVNNEVRPGNIGEINPKIMTYQQVYNGNQNLIQLNKSQTIEMEILLNEYFSKREKVLNNINYNRDKLRNNILTNGAVQEDNLFNENIVNTNKELTSLRNEYLRKMRAVLTEQQVNKLLNRNYIVKIGEKIITNNNELSISGYPIQGMGRNSRFSNNNRIKPGLQCGINYLKRGYK